MHSLLTPAVAADIAGQREARAARIRLRTAAKPAAVRRLGIAAARRRRSGARRAGDGTGTRTLRGAPSPSPPHRA